VTAQLHQPKEHANTMQSTRNRPFWLYGTPRHGGLFSTGPVLMTLVWCGEGPTEAGNRHTRSNFNSENRLRPSALLGSNEEPIHPRHLLATARNTLVPVVSS